MRVGIANRPKARSAAPRSADHDGIRNNSGMQLARSSALYPPFFVDDLRIAQDGQTDPEKGMRHLISGGSQSRFTTSPNAPSDVPTRPGYRRPVSQGEWKAEDRGFEARQCAGRFYSHSPCGEGGPADGRRVAGSLERRHAVVTPTPAPARSVDPPQRGGIRRAPAKHQCGAKPSPLTNN